jgi:hypothetical protein
MRNRSIALMVCTQMVLAGASMVSSARAEDPSCGMSTSEAVSTLPAPLNRWGQIVCTESGQVITGHEGWIWVEPTRHAIVIIPSQNLRAKADERNVDADQMKPEGATGEGKSYFTKIEFTKVRGDEFDQVYKTFHSGFDDSDGKPAAYRLDLKTMSGKEIRLYMFDYFTYAWAMACSGDACDPSSRFVMVNTHEDPKTLPQPI